MSCNTWYIYTENIFVNFHQSSSKFRRKAIITNFIETNNPTRVKNNRLTACLKEDAGRVEELLVCIPWHVKTNSPFCEFSSFRSSLHGRKPVILNTISHGKWKALDWNFERRNQWVVMGKKGFKNRFEPLFQTLLAYWVFHESKTGTFLIVFLKQ